MTRLALLTISLLLSLYCQKAMAESNLGKIAKADSKDIVQVFFSFDVMPRFSEKISTKRVDVILEDTLVTDTLQIFENDDRIIRVVPSASKDSAIISFFFRYQPQKVTLQPSSDGKLVMEILLGNRYSRSYQDLSERLKGLTVVEEKVIDFSNPLTYSPYAYDWNSFFTDYEPSIDISVPILFTAPPFPVIALIPPDGELNRELLPVELYELADQQLYNDMLPLILEKLQTTTDIGAQKLLALTYGEALLKSRDYQGAYKQLYLLQKEYPDEHVGIVAQYLLTLLEARFRDPFLADYDYRKLEEIITPTNPLAPYFLLSRIETALATKQYDRAQQLLHQDDVGFPGNSLKLKELRQGDYYSGSRQLVKAFVSYQLLRDTPLLEAHPFSLNGYCNTLYLQKKFAIAAECYRELAPRVSESTPLGLIAFRTSMSELHFKPDSELIDSFTRIEDAFPDSEGGARAALKQTDLRYLNNRGWAKQGAQQYGRLASSFTLRATVAEAAFKEALLYSLAGEKAKSIDLLMTFLRSFRVSDLRETAQALLIDILPAEIERLIADGKYMDALVLSKQNRDLFQNNWLDVNLLADIARAYQRVGIFSEAQRVYLYLIEVADVEKREQFFLPLVQSVFDQGEYNMVEDLGSQYNYNYPDGQDHEAILILRLRALIASSQFANARALLPNPLPIQPEIRLLAAEIFFQEDDYASTRDALEPIFTTDNELSTAFRFMLAESRFQLADYLGASPIFSTLVDDEQFSQQSLYRLAQIERSMGNEENALKLFEKIVEKENDTLWKKYAEKELEYSKLTKSIDSMIDG